MNFLYFYQLENSFEIIKNQLHVRQYPDFICNYQNIVGILMHFDCIRVFMHATV